MVARNLGRAAGALLLSTAWVVTLGGCKRSEGDQADRPLPAPEPPPIETKAEAQPAEPPRAARHTSNEPRGTEHEPTADAPPEEPVAGTSAATPAPTAASSAPKGSASATPPLPTALPDAATACASKCQGSLSGCLTKPMPLDGGAPSLEAMAECKKAFEECRAACSP